MAIVGVASAVLLFMIISAGDEAVKSGESNAIVDTFMNIAYIVLFLTVAIVLIFVVKGLFTGDIKKTLTTVGAFVAVIAISYVLSSGSDLDLKPFNNKGLGITESVSKNVGAGLYAFYILGAIAIGSMLYGGAKNVLNK